MRHTPLAILICCALAAPAWGQTEPEQDAFELKEAGLVLEMASVVEDRKKNLENAAVLYREAAIRGNARAQQLLANAYRHGRGVPQNDFLALVWYMASGFMAH